MHENFCRRCQTLLAAKRQLFCCDRGGLCYADINVVKRAVKQNPELRQRLIKEKIIDKNGAVLKRTFWKITPFSNQCLIYEHRPVPCRVHFCRLWAPFLKEHKNKAVDAGIKRTALDSLIKELKMEFAEGPQASHGGGYFIFTEKPEQTASAIARALKSHLTCIKSVEDIESLSAKVIQVVADPSGALKGRALLFATQKTKPEEINKDYSFIFVSGTKPEGICHNSHVFLSSFLTFKSYSVEKG